jgi:lipopolysaccharide transport system permease protein
MSQSNTISVENIETIVLRPSQGWTALNLRDLWVYRELLFFLTWRELKVRYQQTLLGASWAVIQPVMQMLIFSVVFGGIARMSSDGIPYPVFSYTALLPWGLFSKALTDAGRSMVMNRNMITKIYFPRLIIPMSSVFSGLVDFAIAFIILIGLMIYYHIYPTVAIWTLPLFIILAVISALGVGLWLSAMNVLYRDVGHVLPFLTQFWMFVTPVIYPASKIPEKWRLLYALNPMTGVVEGFRWALLGTSGAPGAMIAISSVISILILIGGLFYFKRMERTFADEI